MGRWEPDARGRLERAALELFVERGFAETTVPQITARAGLTTRTFFRHFADKREVLFAGEEQMPALTERMIAEAPAELDPMTLIAGGLGTVAESRFEGRRAQLLTRRAVVRSDDGLQERELRKMAALTAAISDGLRGRGIDELSATLAAHTATTVFSVAIGRWLDQDGDEPLAGFVTGTLHALGAVTTALTRGDV